MVVVGDEKEIMTIYEFMSALTLKVKLIDARGLSLYSPVEKLPLNFRFTYFIFIKNVRLHRHLC